MTTLTPEPAVVAGHAVAACDLGAVQSCSVITTGFEDINLAVATSTGRYVVKVFAGTRSRTVAARTVGLIQAAVHAGVRHPRLVPDRDGRVLHTHPSSGTRFLVMERALASDFYSPPRAPTGHELADLIAQTVLIHSIDAHPAPVSDPWAITNLGFTAARASGWLDAEQRRLVARAVDTADTVDRAALPRCLIHGDLTKGNVLAAADGTVFVIDFAVANQLPRVQELVVIAANLTHGSADPLPQRAAAIADLYSSFCPLTHAEIAAVQPYTAAAAAMEFLGALSEHHTGPADPGRSDETTFLIDLGLAGLREIVG